MMQFTAQCRTIAAAAAAACLFVWHDVEVIYTDSVYSI